MLGEVGFFKKFFQIGGVGAGQGGNAFTLESISHPEMQRAMEEKGCSQ